MRDRRRTAGHPPRRWTLVRVGAIIVTALALGSCIRESTANANVGQTVMEIGDAVRALQQETAVMQDQVDSLLKVVARQDTLIRRLSGIAPAPQPAP